MMIVLVSSFLIYVNLCVREDARARVFRTSAAPLQLKPIYLYAFLEVSVNHYI